LLFIPVDQSAESLL
jgi:hypothetical protein